MKTIGKILLCAAVYALSVMLSGILAPVLHFPAMHAPENYDMKYGFLFLIAATPLLAIGLAPLAAGLRGSWAKRALAIAALVFVTIGLNTVIEALVFTNINRGGNALLSVHWIIPATMMGAVVAYCFGSTQGSAMLRPRGVAAWSWRLLLAWLAFPVIYYLFGMCVAPFVMDAYRQGIAGLTIPAQSVIIRTQLLRSALFLAASLPAVLLWKRSRRQFILAMGLAHAMMVGIFQLVQATFLPGVLRVAHSIEITADSFAYAAVLGLLFVSKTAAQEARPKPEQVVAISAAS